MVVPAFDWLAAYSLDLDRETEFIVMDCQMIGLGPE